MNATLSSILLLVLILGTGVRGYPPQERLMPDGAPVAEEDATDHEDSMASASELASEVASDQYDDDEDDSDMFMEPDGTGGVAITAEADGATDGKVNGEGEHPRDTELTIESRTTSSVEKSIETDSQNFFPSFAELFGNQRLPFTESQQQQQQRYRPNRFLGYFQRDRGAAYQASASNAKDTQHPLLGSGNFGVIRGGTYYPEEKENDEYSADESLYNPYFSNGNGRARANYYRNPKPQPVRGGDFFANFRDFADITAPPKSSFSHLSVVYANKNGSSSGRIVEPRNIIETLKMLEEEEGVSGVTSITSTITTTTTELPTKKLSKAKRKLIKMKQYEEDKARRSRVPVEPLLALS